MKYPITNPEGVPAHVTGRILIITDPAEFTPAVFMRYINESFIPVAQIDTDGVISFDFASYGEADGVYTITIGKTSYTSEDPNTAYAEAD